MNQKAVDVVVIGAGSIGVAVAYFLKKHRPALSVALVDQASPLSLTSAHSGENYRNWWPHPTLKQFMDRSIALMEEISEQSDNAVRLSRFGYLLATRESSPDPLLTNLSQIYAEENELRFHRSGGSYSDSLSDATAAGVDVLENVSIIQSHYPYLDEQLRKLIHIRHAGTVDTQQLGAWMLQKFKQTGGQLLQGQVVGIEQNAGFHIEFQNTDSASLSAEKVVNAAGPFVGSVCRMLGVDLPIQNVLQQKIAFEDTAGAIVRSMPFAIDLDSQRINWSAEERDTLQQEEAFAHLLGPMSGSVHCRPEGESWIKLGWAFNTSDSPPMLQPELLDYFPEVVIRGASRLLPALSYYLEGLPRGARHYGGYYTMTEENWPLIGDTSVPGFYIAGAMSGFGSMAACATGELLSQIILELPTENYASALSLQRYNNDSLMAEIQALQSKGIL